MDLATDLILVAAGILLAVAAALVVARMARGPGSLDRVIAADVLVAVVIAGAAAEAVDSYRSTSLLVILVFSLLGFTGSVSVARLVARERR